ncbi:hypothetical protein DEO72_LG3g1506 [Vigna unguiculata]|uniref:Uncharacterized protein n=1 Tax=Vigna unguiculata TaxID=3917 RepID=A0A4D6LF58_VIGUN|nr:hypothetical protein DEO72_LG3g1506 [Vigna unguiculata]
MNCRAARVLPPGDTNNSVIYGSSRVREKSGIFPELYAPPGDKELPPECEKEECTKTFLQRLEKDLELDQWWCKKDSRISNWSKEYKKSPGGFEGPPGDGSSRVREKSGIFPELYAPPGDKELPPGGLYYHFALRRLGCTRRWCSGRGMLCHERGMLGHERGMLGHERGMLCHERVGRYVAGGSRVLDYGRVEKPWGLKSWPRIN